jgi:hypothetical protein
VSAAALSARAIFSPSVSSRAARPRWSWARVVATLASHATVTERAPSRSSRARRNASSPSTSAVLTLSIAEAPPATWAPCSGGRSNRASALYASHRSGDLRASTRASRASYCPGTSEGRRRGGRGRCTSPGPGAPAPAANKQCEKSGRQQKHAREIQREEELQNSTKPNQPGRRATRDHYGSAAPRSTPG